MTETDKEYVLKHSKEQGVKFIRLWFTDILGFLKSFAITIEDLEEALEEGVTFDGASIEGFTRRDERDMVALPDPDSFQILPWRPTQGGSVARLYCDIYLPDGTPCAGDPRYVLRRNLERAAALGYTYYVGLELEFFYFRLVDGRPQTLDQGGYFDLTPLDLASDLRRETILALEAMGIGVEFSHHEASPSQHEIDLRYTDALTMADNTVTYRLVVKEVAMKQGITATFMPKPLFGVNGSGMHTYLSLFRGETNAFFDNADPQHLSPVARGFIAGLLRHAPEITLVTNQWVNSYKRLVPGFEAPIYVSWAERNRSDLIRVPMIKPGKHQSARIEYRAPDPACNPYLAFAALLAAGIEGIERGYELPPPADRNVLEMSEDERRRMGIGRLPEDLWEAIKLAEGSELLRRALGDTVFETLLAEKRREWETYRSQVTSWELDRYLAIL